mmetsp:Transcript_18811/g.51827  ORF Transcript_18811/g.51827 Transcript_18811/m.51827 type:complete len:209 (+) Transcript_18811:43-669(+)
MRCTNSSGDCAGLHRQSRESWVCSAHPAGGCPEASQTPAAWGEAWSSNGVRRRPFRKARECGGYPTSSAGAQSPPAPGRSRNTGRARSGPCRSSCPAVAPPIACNSTPSEYGGAESLIQLCFNACFAVYRSWGSVFNRAQMRLFAAPETFFHAVPLKLNLPSRTLACISSAFCPPKGRRPDRLVYMTTPQLHMSHIRSYLLASTCGAM